MEPKKPHEKRSSSLFSKLAMSPMSSRRSPRLTYTMTTQHPTLPGYRILISFMATGSGCAGNHDRRFEAPTRTHSSLQIRQALSSNRKTRIESTRPQTRYALYRQRQLAKASFNNGAIMASMCGRASKACPPEKCDPDQRDKEGQ